MGQQTQHTVMLYPRDKAGVDILKRRLSEKEGRPIAETAVIRRLIHVGLAVWAIEDEEITKELKGEKE